MRRLAAARDVLMAAFAEVNAQGGSTGGGPSCAEDSGRAGGRGRGDGAPSDGGVLALVGSAFDGDPALRARLLGGAGAARGAPGRWRAHPGWPAAPLAARAMPPGGARPGPTMSCSRCCRGLDVLARVATAHLAGAPATAGALALVVHTRDRAGEAWAPGARAEAAHRRPPRAAQALSFEPGRLSPRDVAGAARAHGARAVLFWGPGADLASARAALDDAGSAAPISRLCWDRSPGALRRLELAGRVLFLYPGSLGERERASEERCRRSCAGRAWRRGRSGSRRAPTFASQIAIEALKRAGAHATREGLIAALEQLRDFDAGPAPPVTFARNRRTGVLGASVFRIDPASGCRCARVGVDRGGPVGRIELDLGVPRRRTCGENRRDPPIPPLPPPARGALVPRSRGRGPSSLPLLLVLVLVEQRAYLQDDGIERLGPGPDPPARPPAPADIPLSSTGRP